MKKQNAAFLGIFGGLILVGILFLIGGVLLIAATGFIKIPLLTALLGADKPRDLGVRTDPAYFTDMLNKQDVKLEGSVDKFCLECYITYSDMKPMDISVTSSELSSWISATNIDGTLKDVQVKLGSNNNMEMSGNLDLRNAGYDFNGPIYAAGKIVKSGTNTLKIEINKAEAGLIPVPGDYAQKGADELEGAINQQLARMPGLNIEDFSVENGALHYKGNFPSIIRAN
jgi:hypothetical protein